MTIKRTFDADFPNRPDVEGTGVSEYLVSGLYVWAIGGEPTPEEVAAFLAPPVAPPHLNSGMLIRFSATNPIVVYENLGLAGVARLTKGRYRISHLHPMPSDQYSVFPDVMDAADKRVRYTVRTVDFVEVKVVDAAGAAADATEVSVKIERVVTST